LSRGEVCQASETPALKFLVRQTCGGRDRIDASLTAALKKLKLEIVTERPASPLEAALLPTPTPASTPKEASSAANAI